MDEVNVTLTRDIDTQLNPFTFNQCRQFALYSLQVIGTYPKIRKKSI